MNMETTVQQKRTRIGRNAGIVGICVNMTLFVVKLITGIVTGSVSIVADAMNNVSDAASSILVMLGYVLSAKPADKKHPFGHARMEYLCSLMISILVTILGVELLTSSAEQLLHPQEAAVYSKITVCIMGCAILAKIFLAVFYRRLGKKIQSDTLLASAADSVGDVCATAAVIAGIFLTPVLGPRTDGVLGCGIALYIFIMGVRLILEAVNTLLGAPPDVALITKIVDKLKSYDGVLGIHDLMIHNYGMNAYFVTVHVEVDADRDVMESHELIDRIEVEFAEQMGMHLVIHLDPVSLHDERVNELRSIVQTIVAELGEEYASPISMHDFRAVFGPNRSNLLFDIAVSYDMPLDNTQLVDALCRDIHHRLGENYKAVITVDRDYSSHRYSADTAQ